MNQNLKIVLISLGTCLISFGLAILVNQVMIHLPDITMFLMNKYLISSGGTFLDLNLIVWFPLILGFFSILSGSKTTRSFFRRFVWTFISLILWLTIGVVVATLTWKAPLNPLLPDYLKFQPFGNYWTIFIVLGILTPLVIELIRNKNKLKKDKGLIVN